MRDGRQRRWLVLVGVCVGLVAHLTGARAGELTVELRGLPEITSVGAIARWDPDGNAVRPVNAKARIEAPEVTATAKSAGGGRWKFASLAPGRYDLVVLTKDRVRLEGFEFPPVLEFDPFLTVDQVPAESAVEAVRKQIALSKQYENKVTPLFFAGNDKSIRVLMQLLRDEATSFDGDFGQPVATLRHEVWQYSNQYGGWVKEKRTRVFDRILMGKKDLRGWTWLWDPRLGGIVLEQGSKSVLVEYSLPLAGPRTRGLTAE